MWWIIGLVLEHGGGGGGGGGGGVVVQNRRWIKWKSEIQWNEVIPFIDVEVTNSMFLIYWVFMLRCLSF